AMTVAGVKGSQTQTGNAGKLLLGISTIPYRTPAGTINPDAFDPADALMLTSGFSVAAIPISLKAGFVKVLDNHTDHGDKVTGVEYSWKVTSDSGDVQDLDMVRMSEVLRTIHATGPFVGGSTTPPKFYKAIEFSGDVVGLPGSNLNTA